MKSLCLRLLLLLGAAGVLLAAPPLSELDSESTLEAALSFRGYSQPALPLAELPVERDGPKSIRLYRLSVAALVVANAADASSSWGKYEKNGILAGESGVFDQRSLLLKAGVLGIVVATQYLFGRNSTKARKIATIMNFTSAAVYGSVAAHNYQVRR